jgi:hypothetical protein
LGVTCDAIPAAPGFETCNSIDDDCDSLVDFRIANGRPESVCVCASVPVSAAVGERDGGETATAPSVCSVAPGAIYGMEFTLGACTDPFPWAQCKFSYVQMERFDADHANEGVLRVSFCTDRTLFVGLSLYYGEYPRRKRLDLLFFDERVNGLAPGCYVRYFSPSDAVCIGPLTDPADPAYQQLEAPCRNGCANGRWAAADASCTFPYDQVPLWLTAEFCAADMLANVTLSEVTVSFLQQTCVCLTDADCKDLSRPFCDLSARVVDGRCGGDGRCAGICISG